MSRETVVLKYPVTVDGVPLQELAVRRPKVRDLLAAEKAGAGQAAQEIRLFANLCEVPPGTIEELDMADYRALQEVAAGFNG